MTKRKYVRKTIKIAIGACVLGFILIAFSQLVFIDLKLSWLSVERAEINENAALTGWTQYHVECWGKNLDATRELTEASKYASFVFNLHPFLKYTICFCEFWIAIIISNEIY